MARKKEEPKVVTETGISSIIASIEKQFGEGSIMKLAKDNIKPLDVIPTGSIYLDKALGVGGIPLGRIVELFGKESSGKSTLALNIVRECQKLGKLVAYLDSEHGFDVAYAEKIGVNLEDLIFSQPDSGDVGLGIVQKLVESGEISLIIVDSVTTLVPQAIIDGDVSDSHMASQARMMSQALKKLCAVADRNKVAVIFINQVRQNINTFGNAPAWVPTGGNSLRFFASIRIELSRVETIKKNNESLAVNIKAKIVKSKVAAPYKEANFEIWFDVGMCRVSDVIKVCLETKILEQKGAWFAYKGTNIAQGSEALRKKLYEDAALLAELKAEIAKLPEDF